MYAVVNTASAGSIHTVLNFYFRPGEKCRTRPRGYNCETDTHRGLCRRHGKIWREYIIYFNCLGVYVCSVILFIIMNQVPYRNVLYIILYIYIILYSMC